MNPLNEQQFPPSLILDYTRNETGKKRFLTYTIFRFFSFVSKDTPTLLVRLKEMQLCPKNVSDFSLLEDYLSEDYYFSPSFASGSLEPLLLYSAIRLMDHVCEGNSSFADELIISFCPVAAGLSYTDLSLSSHLQTADIFYAALFLAVTHYEETLSHILPKFTEAYRPEFQFTCEDFILFDFMDEYFQQKNCRLHPSFLELTNTLVTATLNYHNTDFKALLDTQISSSLDGTASKLAGIKRMGAITLPPIVDRDTACHKLAEQFRYAALYELRNNLFDFHLDMDKLITLENWKEMLRWHYVQYSNVYESALSSFYASLLSSELLKVQFKENINLIWA